MKRFIVISFFIIAAPLMLLAQHPTVGIGGDYESLTKRVAMLLDRETNINQQLDEARKVFSSGTISEQEIVALRIVKMERELFELRSEIDSLNQNIVIYDGVRKIDAVVSEVNNDTMTLNKDKILVRNDYFKNNLSSEDYAVLLEKQAQESLVAEKLSKLKKNYDNLALLSLAYKLADKKEQADSIYARLNANVKSNNLLAEEIEVMWGDLFDTKVYTYNYILDKVGAVELLSEQERQMNNLYMLEEDIAGEYMYDISARYALQKLLLVGYETRLAENAELMSALDSLRAIQPTSSNINDYFMPTLNLTEKIFYDFAEAVVVRPSKYTSAWQLPEVIIFPTGVIYRVLLGAYTRPPQIASLKGVYPLSQEKKADGKHYYYAGGYDSFEKAENAVKKMKALGFSNPRVVGWCDGVYEDINLKETSKEFTPKRVNNAKGVKYRIELETMGDGLSSSVREVIKNRAVGKEVSKMQSTDDKIVIFVVSAFSNKNLAEALVADIKAVEPTMSVRILEIK